MSITTGTWRAKALKGDLGFTLGGKEKVAVVIEFLDEPNRGQRLTWYGYFSDKTADRTLESLMTMGWDGDDLSELKGLGGAEFQAVVEEDMYEGKKQIKIQWINKLSGDTPNLGKRMEGGDRASFAQKMKGRALALKQQQKQAETSDPMDDLPF